jgi:putative membrane protein
MSAETAPTASAPDPSAPPSGAPTPTGARNDRLYAVLNGVVSVAALALLTWLLVLRSPETDTHAFAFMPAVNASFNALSTTCIVLGLLAVRAKRTAVHRALMLSALGSSALFLAGYLFHHYVHGDTPFPAEHALRPVYLAILASHVVLSAVAFPMVLWTFGLALRGEIARHRRFAKWTYPIWLYVSATGVVVFLMLRMSGA